MRINRPEFKISTTIQPRGDVIFACFYTLDAALEFIQETKKKDPIWAENHELILLRG